MNRLHPHFPQAPALALWRFPVLACGPRHPQQHSLFGKSGDRGTYQKTEVFFENFRLVPRQMPPARFGNFRNPPCSQKMRRGPEFGHSEIRGRAIPRQRAIFKPSTRQMPPALVLGQRTKGRREKTMVRANGEVVRDADHYGDCFKDDPKMADSS